MTYHEWKERKLSGAALLRQDAKSLERAIRYDYGDEVCAYIIRRITDDLKRVRTSRKLIDDIDNEPEAELKRGGTSQKPIDEIDNEPECDVEVIK